MLTTKQEYESFLYKIQSNNPPKTVSLVPKHSEIYEINLNTREIQAPEYLSVEKDHKSEIIYFRVPRYFDNMDLSTTTCVIEYKNANNKVHIYVPQYYDIDTLSYGNNKSRYAEMIIPWELHGPITESAGSVSFAFKFFKSNAIYQLVNIKADNYVPNYYYIYTGNNFYEISDEFKSAYTYYEKVNNVYKVKALTKETFVPNKYYINISNQYVIDNGFNSECVYYEKIGDNHTVKQLNKNTYQPNTYYIKQDEEYILDKGYFDSTKQYFVLQANISYRLNTCLATSKILQGSNFEEKYVIADVNQINYTPGYFYKKSASGTYYLCNDSAYNETETYYEFFIQETNIDSSLVSRVTSILNRLENLNNDLDIKWEVLDD